MSRVGRAWVRTGFILPLLVVAVLAAALPSPARAEHAPPGPDGLPATNPKHPWKLFVGAPRVDTLSFALRDVVPVARRQFISDQWKIFSLDAGRGQIVTKWKQMHHPLLLLFMGHVNARCTVTMQPLDRNRTRMVFQADLASHRDLQGNPMLGAAKRAYVKAARNYVTEVRAYLDSHRSLSSLTP
jgi:hypothetical protein